MADEASTQMPQELSPRHLRRRLLQLGLLVLLVATVVSLTPGLGGLRHRLDHAAAGWLVVAAVAEVLSAVSYVVIFRAVFCPRMSWRLSYQIGMAEQAANALVPAGGAGGLALGAWALRRGGMSATHIARRTVAFFLLTSLANFGTLVVFAAAFALGIAGRDAAPAFTLGFGGAAVVGIVLTLALPRLASHFGLGRNPLRADASRVKKLSHSALEALVEGVGDSVALLRQRPLGVLVGSMGYMAFDIVALGAGYLAFGYTPGFSVLVVAYIIGQLGGLLPLPGGIGGIEGGLIATFALYRVPLSASAAAIIAYRAVQLWVPGILGSVAFVRLRTTLHRETEAASICSPLAEPIGPRRSARGRPRRIRRSARGDRAPR